MSILTRYGGALLAPVTAGFDPDARSYIARVEAADGQPLENGVRRAINQFVVGCKADGIWNAIKASCILAGARTLNGALVPLVGTNPTNFNFVSGDYNRKTGLKGDSTSKYIDSNRNLNADPQDSYHVSVWITENHTTTSSQGAFIGAGFGFETNAPSGAARISQTDTGSISMNGRRRGSNGFGITTSTPLFYAMNRASSSAYDGIRGSSVTNVPSASEAPSSASVHVFKTNNPTPYYTNARIAFYSIGESVDYVNLRTRITMLMNTLSRELP